MIQVQSVSADTFAPFGTVLEFPPHSKEAFEVLVTEAEHPWRLAVYRFDNSPIQRMECHPTSLESFEPLEGAAILLVAENETPQNQHAFFLDKPVCLKKGIWHQTFAITPTASVKIAENLEVNSEFFQLDAPICLYMA